MSEPLDWSDGAPRSSRFDDIYFSAADGLAESRAVFLQGCGLPQAWAGRRSFTIAELGFGTGLNILALARLRADNRPGGGRLHVFSVEGYPLARAEAARALAAWPELADLAAVLLRQWPDGRRGMHRIAFDGLGLTLDLAVSDVRDALQGWDGRADAWFLDGFAPARNPQMWSPEILALVGERSAPGARAATFTVAGAVRRGLETAGFAVAKRPGFGRKRERLEGVRPGAPQPELSPRVAVVGAGIAGAALARAFRALGAEPSVHEALGRGAGASGNPAALVTPRLDAGFGPAAALAAQAFARAVQVYEAETPQAVVSRGVLQLARTPRDPARFARLADWDGFAPGVLVPHSASMTAAALREAEAPQSLELCSGLVVEPAAVLACWLPIFSPGTVARLEPGGAVWRLLDADGAVLQEAEVVCLAAGWRSSDLAALPLRPVRGQVSWADAAFAGRAAAWGGYAIPTRDGGVLFGATHDRGDGATDVRDEDHDRNLETLALGRPGLAKRLADAPLGGRAGVRAATPDHLPLAGAVPGAPGLFVLSGLGGRGFTLAPLLAEQVAALVLDAPRPLPRALAATVAPGRFEREPSGRSGR